MNVLVITRLPDIDASTRQRVQQFSNILDKSYGIRITISSFYPTNEDFIKYRSGKLGLGTILKYFMRRFREISKYKNFDVIWVLRSVAPVEMTWLFKIMNRKNIPVIYEFDDAIYLGEKATKFRTKLTRNWDKIYKYVKRADRIIVGNEILGKWAENYNENIHVIPTGVNVKDYPVKTNFNSNKVFTIGWIGSVSTAPNLEIMLPAIKELSKTIRIKLIILGGLPLSFDSDNIEYHDIQWSIENQEKLLKEFDVGIAPLYDTPFNRGKCAYKIVQYMATGIPVIASPVGVQTEIIKTYKNGFLANETNEWIDAFLTLANNVELQKQLGSASRIAAEEYYDINILAGKIAKVLQSAHSE